MPIQAELPDGQIFEFEDGTPDAVVDETVRRELGIAPSPTLTQMESDPTLTQMESEVSKPNLMAELGTDPGQDDDVADFTGIGADLDPGKGLAELSGGWLSRPVFEGAGAIAGGVVGGGGAIPSGPGAVAGAIGGAALGAAGGSATFDFVEGALREMGIVTTPEPSLLKKSQEALNAAALEMGFGTAATVIRPVLMGRRLLERVFGLRSAQSIQLQNLAKQQGIDLGAVDVGGQFPKSINATMNVFPVTGTPAREAAQRKFSQVQNAIHSRLNALAPSATTMSELGVNMVAAARKVRGEFTTVSNELYKRFEVLAENASRTQIIPTKNAKAIAKVFANNSAAERILLEDQKNLARPTKDAAKKFLLSLRKLPENITIKQYRGLMDDLSRLFDQFKNDGTDVSKLMDMKKALEGDLNSIRADLLPEAEGDALVEALQTANSFYSKGIVDFQTPVAQRFGRVDKNIFRAGPVRPGTIAEDELAHAALSMRSPQAIQDLANLVGEKNMRQAARNWLEATINESTDLIKVGGDEMSVLNPDKLLRKLKFEGPKSDGLKALLRRADVDPAELQNFLKVVGSIENVADASTFVKRRVTLGGVSALGGLVGFGASGALEGAVAGSAITAAALTFLGRKLSKIVSTPRALRLMTTALDKQAKQSVRQNALAAVVNAVIQTERRPLNAPPNFPQEPGPVDNPEGLNANQSVQ
jgi:hypothetical protein